MIRKETIQEGRTVVHRIIGVIGDIVEVGVTVATLIGVEIVLIAIVIGTEVEVEIAIEETVLIGVQKRRRTMR
mgnify:CR=1 FL=1